MIEKIYKTSFFYFIFTLLFSFLTSCSQPDDNNFLWLLGALGGGTSASPSSGTLPFSVQVDTDPQSSDPTVIDNIVNTSLPIDVYVNINSFDPEVQVLVDIITPDGTSLLIFTPSSNGNYTGTFLIEDPLSNTVIINVTINGVTKTYRVEITSGYQIIINITPIQSDKNPDSDGDGIPDSSDAYPDDPSRAKRVAIPANSGYYTVPFETHKIRYQDHHEKSHRDEHGNHHSGDSRDDGSSKDTLHSAEVDFNDYVATVSGEMDLNANDEVVRLRMKVQHVAGGAENHEDEDDEDDSHEYTHHESYSHGQSNAKSCSLNGEKKGYVLKLNLPAGASYSMNRTGGPANIDENTSGELSEVKGFELLPSSSETIASSNTKQGSVFVPGMTSRVEFIFAEPVHSDSLGNFPYDLYISYKNGRKEIHFPGYVTDSDGNDPYLLSTGFRWVLLIEGPWAWPLEHVNINRAYPDFYNWYSGGGENSPNWYMNPVDSYVFVK